MSTVGIVIPCFNQSRFAAECVRSIEAQSWSDWRAVLIDDASSEPEAADLDGLVSERLTVVHLTRNRGRAGVRNEGVRLLGDVEYVLNVDCDDILTPDYVAKLVAALRDHPQAGLAYGTLRYFGAPHPTGAATWPPHELVPERRFVENVIPGAATMVRREALAQTVGWRIAFNECGAEDYDLWLQIVERGWQAVWVRDAEYLYRQHADSFLSRHGESAQLEQALTLLKFHHRSIRRACGLEEFLAPLVMPALLRSFREGRVRSTGRMLRRLLRYAPAATTRLALRHYFRRIRDV